MSDDLATLQTQRSELLEEFLRCFPGYVSRGIFLAQLH